MLTGEAFDDPQFEFPLDAPHTPLDAVVLGFHGVELTFYSLLHRTFTTHLGFDLGVIAVTVVHLIGVELLVTLAGMVEQVEFVSPRENVEVFG